MCIFTNHFTETFIGENAEILTLQQKMFLLKVLMKDGWKGQRVLRQFK